MSLGFWGQRWIESTLSLKKSRSVAFACGTCGATSSRRRCRRAAPNHQFHLIREMKPDRKSWWLVIDGEKVDLCLTDPGYDVDLYVRLSPCAP